MKKDDKFYTPSYVIQALLDHHKLIPPILEPAAGELAISQMIEKHINQKVVTNDIDKNMPTDTHRDFLECMFSVSLLDLYPTIVTNPPFCLAQEFIEQARRLINPGGDVIMLLKINFLGSTKRVPFWRDNPLYKIIIVTPRPPFKQGSGTDNCEYAWFIWRDGYYGKNPKLIFSEKSEEKKA